MFRLSNDRGPDPRLARYDHLVVHCTATPPLADYVDAAWVDRVHRKRGWSMCGYHAVVTRRGIWQDADDDFPARPIGLTGAHVGACGTGWNKRSFGVALAGGVDLQDEPEDNFTFFQAAVLHRGIRGFLELHPDPGSVTVLGHRDLIALTGAPPKACPSFDLREWMRVGGLT